METLKLYCSIAGFRGKGGPTHRWSGGRGILPAKGMRAPEGGSAPEGFSHPALLHSARTLVCQAILALPYRVKVPAGEGPTAHPYRVLARAGTGAAMKEEAQDG